MFAQTLQPGSPLFLVAGGQLVELLFSASQALPTTRCGLLNLLTLSQKLVVGLEFGQPLSFLLKIGLSKLEELTA